MRKRKIVELDENKGALERLAVSNPEMMQVIADQQSAYFFKKITGIQAEGMARRALIKAHQCMSHVVTWEDLRVAKPFISTQQDNTILVRDLTIFERFGYGFNIVMATVLTIYAATLGGVIIFSGSRSPFLIISGFAITFITGVFAQLVLRMNLPVHSRKKIAVELEKQQQQNKSEIISVHRPS